MTDPLVHHFLMMGACRWKQVLKHRDLWVIFSYGTSSRFGEAVHLWAFPVYLSCLSQQPLPASWRLTEHENVKCYKITQACMSRCCCALAVEICLSYVQLAYQHLLNLKNNFCPLCIDAEFLISTINEHKSDSNDRNNNHVNKLFTLTPLDLLSTQ